MNTNRNWGKEFMNSFWTTKGSDPRSEEQVRSDFEKKREEAQSKISDQSFWEQVEELYEYVVHGSDLSIKALIIGALLYFISPADFIPDVIPGIGYIDDIAIILMVYNRVKRALDSLKDRITSKSTNNNLEDS